MYPRNGTIALRNSALKNESFQNIYAGKEVYCRAKLKNGYTTICGSSYGTLNTAKGDYIDLTTLPEKYRPEVGYNFTVFPLGGDAKIYGVVETNGIVKLYSDVQTNYWAYSATFPAK